MGMKTVAEFVEKELIKNSLTGIGVDYAQGFGIEKPRPLEELLKRSMIDVHLQETNATRH